MEDNNVTPTSVTFKLVQKRNNIQPATSHVMEDNITIAIFLFLEAIAYLVDQKKNSDLALS